MYKNIHVRKLEACETLGSVNEIFTDNKGPITTNDMSVKMVWINDQFIDTEPKAYNTMKSANLMNESALYNCNAKMEFNGSLNKYVPDGKSTENAIITYLQGTGVKAEDVISSKDDHIILSIPFTSRRKRTTTVIRHPDDKNRVRVFLKSSPEIAFHYCTQYLDESDAPK